MAIKYNEKLTEGSVAEQAGEITDAKSVYVVSGWTQTPLASVLADTNLKQVGDAFNTDNPNLTVISRHLTAVAKQEDGSYTLKVEIIFQLERPDPKALRGSSSLVQVETANYPNGTPIKLTHQGVPQGGEVSILVPQSSVTLSITLPLTSPEEFAADWIGKVNLSPWRGGDPYAWIVMAINWELIDDTSNPQKYKLDFDFEQSSDAIGKWGITVVFRQEDGTIPTNLDDVSIGNSYPDAEDDVPPSDSGKINFRQYGIKDYSTFFPNLPAKVAVTPPNSP